MSKYLEDQPTVEQSQAFQEIYTHFDIELFEGTLSEAMLVMSRNKNIVGGYFSPNNWKNEDGTSIHEVGLNANVVAEGDLVKTYIILLHEMVHHWQHDRGTPSRTGYHNNEWGRMCVAIGLQPICHDSGKPEKKLTGQKMDTELIPGGLAESVIANMPFELPWYADEQILIDDDGQPMPIPPDSTGDGGSGDGSGDGSGGRGVPPPSKPRRSGKRTKYQCTQCGLNAWAKHGASLICGDCTRAMVPQV
ncbi:MAG: hypothetical protein GWN77_01095 [Gammaproteobacteria bacterium]|nr:hypothetical protein [Desulfobacterales bacterium]NIR25579.1 hypothetical protein [Gammaproteobacteria bacterium]NIV68493.1 hypothetical protein [Candidatus Bathyarchaeota archaeon]